MWKKRDYAFILANRHQSIPSNCKLELLKSQVGVLQWYEEELLKKYNKLIEKYEALGLYSDYDKSELVHLLKHQTGMNFPLPLNCISSLADVLAYYDLYNQLDELPHASHALNTEQEAIVNASGISIVNSGPGTGKTTTLIAKALHHAMKDEGVILVSYTNASVSEIYERICTYPKSTEYVTKNFATPKRIWCPTVDKIAGAILHRREETYDESITTATHQLPTQKGMFYESGKGLRFHHILVDEAQDVDEIRYHLLFALYKQLNLKSFTAFGDPRQRVLLNRGLWYNQYWTSTSPLVHKYAIQTTYRLQTDILKLSNKLSATRPDLHVELQNPASEPTLIEGYIALSDEQIASVGKKLKELRRTVKSWRDIAFITPSLNAQNATSQFGLRVMAVLKSMDIPCYTREESNYHPNAIYFSTIQGVKGKEYQHIFLMGMDDFPASFPHIEYETAQSLIYVANTRARKSITYLFRRALSFPEGVTERTLTCTPVAVTNGICRKVFGLTKEVLQDMNFDVFLETNGMKLELEPLSPLQHTLPSCPNGLSSRFWGIVCHLLLTLHLQKTYPTSFFQLASRKVVYLDNAQYSQLTGGIDRGRYSGDETYESGTFILHKTINTIQPEEIEKLQHILEKPYTELSCSDILTLALIQDIMFSTSAIARYEEDFNVEFEWKQSFAEVAEELSSLYSSFEFERMYKLGEHCIGVPDLLSTAVLELKTGKIGWKEQLQAYIYGLMTDKEAHLLQLSTGERYRVHSESSRTFWKYILDAFFQLKIHQLIVEERVTCYKRKKYTLPTFAPNTFAVDTEFVPGTAEIFDIALVNLNSPFQSIVSTARVRDIAFAREWLSLPTNAFCHSFNRVRDLFQTLISKHPDIPPTFLYYHCDIDVRWYEESAEKKNVGETAKEVAQQLGYFGVNSLPRCSDIYQLLAHPLEMRNYLCIHTALSDALMLYEMERTGWKP